MVREEVGGVWLRVGRGEEEGRHHVTKKRLGNWGIAARKAWN